MRTKELVLQLQTIGFSDAEARIYLSGLKLGPALLAPLAREAGVPRSTAYEVVEAMEHRRLFTIQQTGKRTLYCAVTAHQLLKETLNREQLIRQLLPHLESLMPVISDASSDEAASAALPLDLEK